MFAMSRNVGPHPLRHVRSMWMRSLGMDRDLGGRWGPGARLCSAGGARLISHGGHGHDPVMDYVSKAIRKKHILMVTIGYHGNFGDDLLLLH